MLNKFSVTGTRSKICSTLDDISDAIIRKSRTYLPHLARFLMVFTFVEDAYRLITQYVEQVGFIDELWGFGHLFSVAFILINILTQFGGSICILSRYYVKIGCTSLFISVISQAIGYNLWASFFVFRTLSLTGSLMLLYAEASHESSSSTASLPSIDPEKSKKYLQLYGRILVILLFATRIPWVGNGYYFIQTICNLILIILVIIGYRTKLCSLLMICWLTWINLRYNASWITTPSVTPFDFIKYEFFQVWSVIGGMMLVVAYGPGDISVDQYKKDI